MSRIDEFSTGSGKPKEPWVKRASTDELQKEHGWVYPMLVGNHQTMGVPHDFTWPAYTGHGDTEMAHEGIIARGHRQTVEELETEMKSRGARLPRPNLSTFKRDVADPEFPLMPHQEDMRSKLIAKGRWHCGSA